jgi:hypothetical protein
MAKILLWSLMAFDLATTFHRGPELREANPLLGQHPVRQASVMIGLTALTDWKGGPKTKLATAAIHGVAGAWNLRVRSR